MIKNPSNRAFAEALKATSSPKPRIVVLVGSAYLSLLDHPQAFENCVVIAIDVPEELARLRYLKLARVRVLTLPLGNSKTLKTLINEHGTAAQKTAFEKFSNVSTVHGLAQLRGCGALAMDDLLSQPDVIKSLENLIRILTELSGGELEEVIIEAKQGSAGGVGSAAARKFLTALVGCLRRYTTKPINVNVQLIGAITYQAEGFERTERNSACSIVDLANFSRGFANVSVRVFASELPTVGRNRELRDSFVLAQHSALSAPIVDERLQMEGVNWGADSPMGNVIQPRATFFCELPAHQIQSDVADAYLPQIDSVLDAEPARGSDVEVAFEHEAPPIATIDVEGLVQVACQESDRQEIQRLIEDLFEPGTLHAAARILSSNVPFEDLVESFSGRIESVDHARRRVGTLYALEDKLLEESQRLDEELGEFQDLAETAREKAVKAIRSANDDRILKLRSQEYLMRNAVQAVCDYVECAQAQHEVEVESIAVERALADVQEVTDELLARFERLRTELLPCLRFGDAIHDEACVHAKPLSENLDLLVAAIDHAAEDAPNISELLVRCAGNVTMHGLAEIVNATDVTVEAIVAAVDSQEAATASPNWGGEVRRDHSVDFVVYPPMDRRHQESLQSQHAALDDSKICAFAKLSAPSRNVVVLQLRHCRDLKDLLNDFYEFALRDALNSELAPLFLEDPKELLQGLGVNIHVTN